MSAGEVERLVSELSGGTGGDEEEEWLYGGTELPVLSPSPGLSPASPPGAQTAVLPGPARPRRGPPVRNRVRPNAGRARGACSPPAAASFRPARTPKHARTPRRRRRRWWLWWRRGRAPDPRPPPGRDCWATSPPRFLFIYLFLKKTILSGAGVSLPAPGLCRMPFLTL